MILAFATHETLVDSSVEQLEIVFNQVARPVIISTQANATYERASKYATIGTKLNPKDDGNLIVGTRKVALLVQSLNKGPGDDDAFDDAILELDELEHAINDADQELVTLVNELGIDMKLTDDIAGWSCACRRDRAWGCGAPSYAMACAGA